MVEENFEIWLSETPTMAQFYYFSCHSDTFTMVEEHFEIRLSETPRMTQFYHFSVIVINFTDWPCGWGVYLENEVCAYSALEGNLVRASAPEHLHLDFFQVRTEDLLRKGHTFQTCLLIRAEVLNMVQGRSPGNFLDFGHSNRWRWHFKQQNMIPIDRGKETVSKIPIHRAVEGFCIYKPGGGGTTVT